MAYEKSYNRIEWKNRPSTATALGATNLNHMDVALNTLDDRIVHLDATKLAIETANSMVKDISFDTQTGIVTITQLDGAVQHWNINLEKIPVSMSLREDAVLILDTEDGLHYEADLKELIDTYIFEDSDTVGFNQTSASDGKHVTAIVKNGSITEEKLEPTIMGMIRQDKLDAQAAAGDALTYSRDAKRYTVGGEIEGDVTDNAKYYKEQADTEATAAQSYARGDTGTREGEETDNAKYYMERAKEISAVEIATESKAGVVKPDGTTITVEKDGTIHGVPQIGIATESVPGAVMASGDVSVSTDGTMGIKTDFIVASEFLNIVADEALKIMLGKLAAWFPVLAGKADASLILDDMEQIMANTEPNRMAGALALKQVNSDLDFDFSSRPALTSKGAALQMLWDKLFPPSILMPLTSDMFGYAVYRYNTSASSGPIKCTCEYRDNGILLTSEKSAGSYTSGGIVLQTLAPIDFSLYKTIRLTYDARIIDLGSMWIDYMDSLITNNDKSESIPRGTFIGNLTSKILPETVDFDISTISGAHYLMIKNHVGNNNANNGKQTLGIYELELLTY